MRLRIHPLLLAIALALPHAVRAQAPLQPVPAGVQRAHVALPARPSDLRRVWRDPDGRLAIRLGAVIGATAGTLLVARYGYPFTGDDSPKLGDLAVGAIGGAVVGGLGAALVYDVAYGSRELRLVPRGRRSATR